MTVKNNPVLGYAKCGGCGGRCSVHQTARGSGRFLYTRCTVCGVDQRAGAPVQSTLWFFTEWLPGLKPENAPANLPAAGSEPGEGPEMLGPELDPVPVLSPDPEPALAPVEPEESAWGALAMVGAAVLGLMALATGRA